MRTYRMLCVERWYMSGVIASAPVLLHVSLLLFGAGLVLFISSDPVTHHLTLGLALAAGVLYLITTLSAVVFSASPFKSPATQMIRAALSALYWFLCNLCYRPKRKPLRTLISEIHAMILRREDGTPFLPGGATDSGHQYTGLWRAIVKTPGAAIASLRQMPSWVCTMRRNLQRFPLRSRLHSIVLVARRLSSDWFLSSMWTDIPAGRRPKLLAEALSWLSSASPAPDVFRAIVFALGDLDVGPQVGKHTSFALRTRIKAEIRRSWKQVDFLTLSRYVLADQNIPSDLVLDYHQFASRFDMSKDSALRCEDGLAAVIVVDPFDILLDDIVRYSPDQVVQPRMLGFLLPHMQLSLRFRTEVLIFLSNRYRTLWMTSSFNLDNLEARLYETLDTETRDKYATAVTVECGGTTGAIELLTFLCCHGIIKDVTVPAAVELVMELLEHRPNCEHRCLAYLFGSRKLWAAAWKDKHWPSMSIIGLSTSLWTPCFHPCEPSSVRTLSDDWRFNLALACTAVMMLSPQHYRLFVSKLPWIEFLHAHLSQSPLPIFADNDEKVDVIHLILESAALLGIVDMPDDYDYPGAIDIWRTTILVEIIRDLGRRLHDPATIHDGEQLFAALARTEVKGRDGKIFIWDLGEWLRTHASEIVKRCPSSASKMQDVYDALSSIYPLCEHNPELRASWDLIGYSGPPEEIIYFSDPYLDLGEFFARAEDPLSQSGV